MNDPWADPFQATTGRGGDVFQISRWLPDINQQYKETAGLLALVFGALAVLLCFYYVEAVQAKHDTQWAEQPWSVSSCSVESVGVAYRGTCQQDTLQMTSYSNFAECQGPSDSGDVTAVRREWLRTSQGQCAEMGNRDYRLAKAVEPDDDGDDGAEGGGGDLGVEVAAMGRRLLPIRPRRSNCHDGYVAWASVRLLDAGTLKPAEPRCAYQFGAMSPSTTGDWSIISSSLEELNDWLDSGASRPCWQLAVDSCVVAFDDPGGLAERGSAGAGTAGVVAGICALIALGATFLALRWHWQDHGCCGIFPPGEYCGLPTQDADSYEANANVQVPLSERVGNIVRSAAARLGDITPGTRSGETSLRAGYRERSTRTVEVMNFQGERVSVPRNVAADFVTAVENAGI